MEIRQINLDGKIYDYQLNIKPIKRCYLRVRQGQIVINSSPRFSINQIEKLIKDNQEVILKQVNSYFQKASYQDGGFVVIFNRSYQIVLIDQNKNLVKLNNDCIYVYNRRIEATITAYLKQVLYQTIKSEITKQLESNFNLSMPAIEIKKYQSRWGSCYPNKNKVSFNLSLVHLDFNLIRYVIVHELAHFIYPNHSKLFYQEIEKRLPDYRSYEKALKGISI